MGSDPMLSYMTNSHVTLYQKFLWSIKSYPPNYKSCHFHNYSKFWYWKPWRKLQKFCSTFEDFCYTVRLKNLDTCSAYNFLVWCLNLGCHITMLIDQVVFYTYTSYSILITSYTVSLLINVFPWQKPVSCGSCICSQRIFSLVS